MKIDPATIKVPDASALAAHDVFWDARFKGEPIDLDLEFDRLFHYAVAAAIAAWPGVHIVAAGVVSPETLILPLTKEDAQ
jgi:hypothetical protein